MSQTTGPMMACKRCGKGIEAEMVGKVDICGTCADDLRAAEEAAWATTRAETEAAEAEAAATEAGEGRERWR